MIGAVILKLVLRGAMNDLNNRRKDKIVANYAEDAFSSTPASSRCAGLARERRQ